MSQFSFGDSYRAAGLSSTPDILALRQEPFDGLISGMDKQMAIDLARIYFGLEVPRGTDWFRDAFASTDSSFSLHDNEHEAAVLAACLLAAKIDGNEEVPALAVLTTSAGGQREPVVLPELIEEARSRLFQISIDSRINQEVALTPRKPIKGPLTEERLERYRLKSRLSRHRRRSSGTDEAKLGY